MAFAGVDMLMDTLKSVLFMSERYVHINAKLKGSLSVLLGEGERARAPSPAHAHLVCTRIAREGLLSFQPALGCCVAGGADANTTSLYERDQEAAICRHRSLMCYNLNCKVLATQTGARSLPHSHTATARTHARVFELHATCT